MNDINICIDDFMQTFNSPPWNEEWSKLRADEYITDLFNSPKFFGFILCEGNENVAYAMCLQRYWWNKADKSKVQMELFFTKPAFQQKGYGTILLEHIEKYAWENGMRGIMLLTKKDMPSYFFYEKNGFGAIDNLATMYKQIEKEL